MIQVSNPLPPREEIDRIYHQNVDLLEKVLHEMQRRIGRTLTTAGIRPTLKYRVKSFDSAYEKLLRRAREVEEGAPLTLTDMLGVRVVCPFVEDLDRVERAVSDVFDVREIERKGSHLGTTEFGYSSVHQLLAIPHDICESFHVPGSWVCEVQIRTILQDAWAEVEHELVYKAELTPLDEKLRRKLAALNANLTLSDIIFQEIRDYQRTLQSRLMRRRETFWAQVGDDDSAPGGDVDAVDLLDTGSDTVDGLVIKALYAHSQRNYEQALRLYDDILAYNPREAIAALIHTHRGMARFAAGNAEGAIEDFSRTVELSPESTKAYYYRGVVLRSLGRDSEALEDFTTCLERDPYHVDSLVARATLFDAAGSSDEARRDRELVARLQPDHPALMESPA